MDFFAVTGRPVLHSKSPLLFNAFFRERTLDAHYTRLAADSAGEALGMFEILGLKGMNVTAPFKTGMAASLLRREAAAERIGAVNVVLREGNALAGYNTDHLGVAGALESRGLELHGKKSLVIGAGGAGRAAAYALIQREGRVTLLNRDEGKARRAAEALGCRADSLRNLEAHAVDADIIVTTVPPGCVDLPPGPARAGQALLDANYQDSWLSRIANERGYLYIGGEEWLEKQAIPTARLFLGGGAAAHGPDRMPSTEAPAAAKRDNVALIGFMGAGKSTVGRELAARLDYDFADLDDVIEQREGHKIQEIFGSRGEAYFRVREIEALENLTSRRRLVLACGGGVVLDAGNRARLAERSLSVWIYASLETIRARMDPGSRPLLTGDQEGLFARDLMARRMPFYFRSADLIVGNEGPVERTIEKIDEEIRLSL